MSWDNITGDSKILPGGGGGNEVKFDSGKPKRLRLLLNPGEEPYSYLEHTAEAERIENGQQIREFRTVRCPKTSKNPNAPCKLCDGQRLRRRVRNAANVWDYDLGQVQKLNQGETVWRPIATTRKLGVDVLNVDWAIMKTGETRNDTEYTATNLGPVPFQLPDNVALFDIEADYAPHTEEEARAILESIGLKWEDLMTVPTLQFPESLDAAFSHKMPNGKYKDQTFKQIWDADPGPRGMINFLATKSDRITFEKACAQVILVALGGANIAGVPNYSKGGAPVQTPTQTQTQTPTQNPVQAPTQNPVQVPAQSAASAEIQGNPAGRQDKINKINGLLSSKPKFIQGGYTAILGALKDASGTKTNINEFTDAELDKMLDICEKV